MDTFAIREIHSHAEMAAQYPLVSVLNPDLQEADYSRMLTEMLKQGYRMVVVYDGTKAIGLSGFWINTKIYCGKYIEPDNVVIAGDYRSKGIGKLLCDWIAEEGKRNGCKMALLDAYVENSGAHRFYFREGYRIRGFHFLKKLQ